MNGPQNLSPSETPSGRPLASSSNAGMRSRDEVRANTSRQSAQERSAQIFDVLKKGREEAAQPPKAEAPPPPAEVDDLDEGEDVEEDTTLDTDDAEPDSAPDTDEDDGDEHHGSVQSLADLAKAFDMDEEDLKSLKATIKVNGRTEEITLGEALSNTQFAKANTEKAQRLASREREFESSRNEKLQQVQQVFQSAKATHFAAVNVLQQELQSQEVQQLKQQDPQAYVQWQDLANQRMGQLQTSYQQLLAQEQQALEAHRAETRKAGLSRLRDALPDFDTPERKTKIRSVLAEFGASEQEMKQILDDRLLLFASKYADMAERLQALEAEKAGTSKRAKAVVEAASASRPAPQRNTSATISRKKVESARKQIQGKKGHAARDATKTAIMTALQEGRKMDRRR